MLALIAGKGNLPRRVAEAQDERPLICVLEGNEPEGLAPDLTFRLETLGSLLLELGQRGVSDVCLCGAIDRPILDPGALDEETRPLVPLFQEALAKGDDGALRLLISLLERTGFGVRAAHELIPGITAQEGVKTRRRPCEGHEADADRGLEVLAEMGAADLGQACVIRKGEVLAREDEAGTDAMLETLTLDHDRPMEGDPMLWAVEQAGELAKSALEWLQGIAAELHEAPGAGGVLVKGPKPGQERRADLPTIGPHTAMRAAEAGLDGIVIEAGGVIVLDELAVIEILDGMNMFLWVRAAR